MVRGKQRAVTGQLAKCMVCMRESMNEQVAGGGGHRLKSRNECAVARVAGGNCGVPYHAPQTKEGWREIDVEGVECVW